MLNQLALEYISPSTSVSPSDYHSINRFTGIYHHHHHQGLVAGLASVLAHIRQHKFPFGSHNDRRGLEGKEITKK
jgi:hypothetical protein